MNGYETKLELHNDEMVVKVTKEVKGGTEEFEIPIKIAERYFKKMDLEVGDELVSIASASKFVVTGKMRNDDIYFLMGSDGDIRVYPINNIRENFDQTGENYPALDKILNSLKTDEELVKGNSDKSEGEK